MYTTRRSAQLAEKKCPEAGVIGRETSQAVKIGSLLEEVGVTLDKDSGNFVSENSVGSGIHFYTIIRFMFVQHVFAVLICICHK